MDFIIEDKDTKECLSLGQTQVIDNRYSFKGDFYSLPLDLAYSVAVEQHLIENGPIEFAQLLTLRIKKYCDAILDNVKESGIALNTIYKDCINMRYGGYIGKFDHNINCFSLEENRNNWRHQKYGQYIPEDDNEEYSFVVDCLKAEIQARESYRMNFYLLDPFMVWFPYTLTEYCDLVQDLLVEYSVKLNQLQAKLKKIN